jgi:parallel beta-helix repeat protein
MVKSVERNRGKEMRSMRRTIVLLATVALTLLVASGVALATAIGSAGAQSSVVGPGESIQKAVNAAEPGDTIVVRGVHREDVVIRKNGIKLRGEDAVIEAPPRAKADSPCSKTFGPEAICVLGDVNIKTGKLEGQRVSDVSVSGFTIRGFKQKPKGEGTIMIDVFGARNATVEGNHVVGNNGAGIGIGAEGLNNTIENNDLTDNKDAGVSVLQGERNATVANNTFTGNDRGIFATDSTETKILSNDITDNNLGMLVEKSTGTKIVSNDITDSTLVGTVIFESTGTKIVSNDISRSGDTGITIFGPERANNDAKVIGNRISGGPWGIFVENAHGGSVSGNQVHDNCAGMVFEAFKAEPVGGFEVKGNTVTHNTRSCRAAQFGINFSSIGIALLGASGMRLTANHLWGNVPSGPTLVSGGVVVSKDPYLGGPWFGGTQKPKDNTVIANHFGRSNKPDIFYDGSGSGNQFRANYCDSSVPSSLCN